MRWAWMFALASLCGCSRGPQADLPSIAAARSLGAEWARVNQQAADGHLTAVYADTMHKELRQELQSTQASLTQPDSNYGREIQTLLRLPDDAPSEALRATASRLKQIEDGLESA